MPNWTRARIRLSIPRAIERWSTRRRRLSTPGWKNSRRGNNLMNRISHFIVLALSAAVLAGAAIPDPVKIETGLISGADLSAGVRAFKGIPFAAPPVGDL